MSALFTALLESESKESLAKMVCELRDALHSIALCTDDPAIRNIAKDALSQLRQEG